MRQQSSHIVGQALQQLQHDLSDLSQVTTTFIMVSFGFRSDLGQTSRRLGYTIPNSHFSSRSHPVFSAACLMMLKFLTKLLQFLQIPWAFHQ